MTEFISLLTWLKRELYEPNGLVVSEPLAETQNQGYAGGVFRLEGQRVRLRESRVTPKKNGQFVAFWEKQAGKNQPYEALNSPEVLVIYTATSSERGMFVLSRHLLAEKGVLTVGNRTGKMGMRVYPPWDCPLNEQAKRTQNWQLPYFIELSDVSNVKAVALKRAHQLM